MLRFLHSERCFSEHGHQVTEEMVLKHVSRELGDRNRKAVRRAVSQLIAHGLVQAKRKHYGLHLWLNHARLDEIRRLLLQPPEAENRAER